MERGDEIRIKVDILAPGRDGLLAAGATYKLEEDAIRAGIPRETEFVYISIAFYGNS
ncbi:hypothetical protein GCM10009764_80370 [Nocardia ninae]|uniref:Uncharacterized protein n=1 Tax=Nocardia ninae NBRC 108245 TaxID=1210091 RepID=A0A511MMN7_9NOCA|nr:hypothetical protein NN4_63980 [Nocardia ninae NBRC 108245]